MTCDVEGCGAGVYDSGRSRDFPDHRLCLSCRDRMRTWRRMVKLGRKSREDVPIRLEEGVLVANPVYDKRRACAT